MKHKTAVQNSGTWKDGGVSRVQRQIDDGLRCAKCQILVFDTMDEAVAGGVSKPSMMINLAVRNDGESLCIGCANGV